MINESPTALLALLQISDSALPIGGYSHSFGLETWIQDAKLQSAEEVKLAISTLLRFSLAPQQGAACNIAGECQRANDIPRFVQLNALLTASTWSKESQNASLQMGQRLLRLARELGWETELLPASAPEFHHAAVFGWLSSLLKIGAEASISAYLYQTCTALVSACVRLVPLGHTDGQRMLSKLQPEIILLTNDCLSVKNESEIQSFAPMHERACVQHESLYSRLCQS